MLGSQTVTQMPWFEIPIFTALLTAVLSGLFAWLGGKAGVTRESEKLVRQRAFDHRLEWYVRISRTLSSVQFLFSAMTRPNVDNAQATRIRDQLLPLVR